MHQSVKINKVQVLSFGSSWCKKLLNFDLNEPPSGLIGMQNLR